MPDLWDTNPEHVFGTPDEQPDPAPNDHPKEMKRKDLRGRTRLPADILLALLIAVASILFLIAALLLAPS
jgi:hypothetical protein